MRVGGWEGGRVERGEGWRVEGWEGGRERESLVTAGLVSLHFRDSSARPD